MIATIAQYVASVVKTVFSDGAIVGSWIKMNSRCVRGRVDLKRSRTF